MGKDFPSTPAGFRAAADYVWSLSPAFEQDGYELLREAQRLEQAERLDYWLRMAFPIFVLAVTAAFFYFG